MSNLTTSQRCIIGLIDCLEGCCRWWDGARCTWTPPAPVGRRTTGAVLRMGAR